MAAPPTSRTAPVPAGLGAVRWRVRASDDVNEHADQLSDWSQEYDQLRGGRFAGRVRELWLSGPRLQVFHEHTSQPTSQQCAPWAGSVWFGLPDARCAQPLHFCGTEWRTDAQRPVLRARASGGFTLRTPQDFGIYGVVMDQQWLGAEADAMQLRGAAALLASPAHAVPLPPAAHAALCATIEALLRLSDGAAESACTERHQALARQLLRLLCGDAAAVDAACAAPRGRAQRRFALVMAARAWACQPCAEGDEARDLPALCEHLHVTRRTLQNHFHAVLGQSPAEFLKAVRLNACRRALRTAAPGDTVQDTAARWGFFHMGHFSQDYKSLFGEAPSHTLRQHAGQSR
ncbi:helix-turn-helix domain-containing protein [Acidovorax sp. FG27]|uniref:helix-turn-helix domain-containing protein n=1 Tax=Acidovorax sp. FG27 TaxID=3133652 RepID=UPI0030E74B68